MTTNFKTLSLPDCFEVITVMPGPRIIGIQHPSAKPAKDSFDGQKAWGEQSVLRLIDPKNPNRPLDLADWHPPSILLKDWLPSPDQRMIAVLFSDVMTVFTVQPLAVRWNWDSGKVKESLIGKPLALRWIDDATLEIAHASGRIRRLVNGITEPATGAGSDNHAAHGALVRDGFVRLSRTTLTCHDRLTGALRWQLKVPDAVRAMHPETELDWDPNTVVSEPGGRWFAVPCYDGIVLFDAQHGQVVCLLQHPSEGQSLEDQLAISPGGRFLFALSEENAVCFDLHTGASHLIALPDQHFAKYLTWSDGALWCWADYSWEPKQRIHRSAFALPAADVLDWQPVLPQVDAWASLITRLALVTDDAGWSWSDQVEPWLASVTVPDLLALMTKAPRLSPSDGGARLRFAIARRLIAAGEASGWPMVGEVLDCCWAHSGAIVHDPHGKLVPLGSDILVWLERQTLDTSKLAVLAPVAVRCLQASTGLGAVGAPGLDRLVCIFHGAPLPLRQEVHAAWCAYLAAANDDLHRAKFLTAKASRRAKALLG